jgi:coenzyme F420-reducing hydrogenase beta subunit
MIESFAQQLGTEVGKIRSLDYRVKNPSRPANWYRAQMDLKDGGTVAGDWWHFADGDWGAGFLQNPACDFCDDVVAETADIAFGDAWVEPYASDGAGTNVVIARAPALKAMLEAAIEQGRLALRPVDSEFVAETQAAGLRHRREGLAFRLAKARQRPVRPRKRVTPSTDLPRRRRMVYAMRAAITRWSHPMMRISRTLHAPWLYTVWARLALRLYQSLAWSRGRLGRLFDRVLSQPRAD